MIMKANKQIGFIYKNNESIDRILKDGDVVFERGFLRERTTTTLPITFGGVGKNLKDYKIYGNTKQQILPDGYTQVDYIESSGTQYIDTGVNADYKLSLLCELAMVSAGGAIGAIGSNTELRHHFNYVINQGIRYYYKSISTINQVQLFPLGQEDTNKHKYFIDIYNSKVQIDDGTVKDLTERDEYDIQTNYWICKRNSPNSALQSNMSVKVYTFKMYKENVLVRDFIPCYRNSDNEVGLYDLVNDVFYTNEGTGTFTYGSIAPIPDTPIEMVSCGDRTKNLCGELEQGSYSATTGEKTEATTYRNKEPIKVLPNTNYIFSINGEGQAINVFEYKDDGTFIGRIGSGAISANNYFTTSSETAYINIFRGASAGIEKWQIEQNDTISSYEPYGYKIPVNVRSENLFDKDNVSVGYINPAGGLNPAYSEYKTSNYIKIKPNTVYYKTDSGSTRFKYFDENFNVISDKQSDLDNATSKQSFETPANVRFLRITVHDNYLNTFQIVEGSTAPSKYISYYNETTNIYLDEPLRKIDKYSDYIDFINGKVVRNIGNKVLNGSENGWYISGKAAKIKLPDVGLTNISELYNYSGSLGNLAYCDYFKQEIPQTLYTAGSLRVDVGFGIAVNPSTSAGLFFANNISSLNDFKTWLQSNNVTVDYVLATPTEEDIELTNIPTVDENNTLNIETEITPSQVYIKYKSNT